MTHRLIAAVSRALRPRLTGDAPETPHFHQGAQGRPAACFDARCPRPHLPLG